MSSFSGPSSRIGSLVRIRYLSAAPDARSASNGRAALRVCGIAGIAVLNPDQLNVDDLRLLGRTLRHRGPDGEGVWVRTDGLLGLVHRRLAILDLSERGTQPMSTPDGKYTIVFNGEIFNFLELRRELEQLGSRFVSDSDTEVVLHAWSRWGAQMLLRFNGMWALAISDNSSGELFLARDRFGIKPLLISQVGDRFAFASEMRALRSLAWVPDEADSDVAARMLYAPFSIEGSSQTLVRSIKRLPGGHYASFRAGRLTIRRWWKTSEHLSDVPKTSREQIERFRELFCDAVRLRLRADVPVGTCLSGGFDSSAVACTMTHVASSEGERDRQARDWRHAFIASFPGKSNDETAQALATAAFAKVSPHLVVPSDDDALQHIDGVLTALDDIYIGVPTAAWLLYRELRHERVLVSLDGHGADELMGGYRQQRSRVAFGMHNLFNRLTTSSRQVAWAAEAAKATWLTFQKLNFLRDYRWEAPRAPEIPSDADELPDHWDDFNRRLYRMFHGTVLPTILRNFDRISMAHGIEIRMPFMDWRLVTYTMALPDQAKAEAHLTKTVARHAMAGIMPDDVRLSPRKVGFSSPMPEWLNGPLGRWAEDTLARPNALFERLVDVASIRAHVRDLSARRAWDWMSAGRLWPYIHLNWFLCGGGTA